MSDDTESSALPVTTRAEALIVVLVCAVLRMLGPLSGFIDERWGVFSDDLADHPQCIAHHRTHGDRAAVLVATTPQVDLVPSLRTATVVIVVTLGRCCDPA